MLASLKTEPRLYTIGCSGRDGHACPTVFQSPLPLTPNARFTCRECARTDEELREYDLTRAFSRHVLYGLAHADHESPVSPQEILIRLGDVWQKWFHDTSGRERNLRLPPQAEAILTKDERTRLRDEPDQDIWAEKAIAILRTCEAPRERIHSSRPQEQHERPALRRWDNWEDQGDLTPGRVFPTTVCLTPARNKDGERLLSSEPQSHPLLPISRGVAWLYAQELAGRSLLSFDRVIGDTIASESEAAGDYDETAPRYRLRGGSSRSSTPAEPMSLVAGVGVQDGFAQARCPHGVYVPDAVSYCRMCSPVSSPMMTPAQQRELFQTWREILNAEAGKGDYSFDKIPERGCARCGATWFEEEDSFLKCRTCGRWRRIIGLEVIQNAPTVTPRTGTRAEDQQETPGLRHLKVYLIGRFGKVPEWGKSKRREAGEIALALYDYLFLRQTQDDTAAFLGLTVNAVKKRLQRFRQKTQEYNSAVNDYIAWARQQADNLQMSLTEFLGRFCPEVIIENPETLAITTTTDELDRMLPRRGGDYSLTLRATGRPPHTWRITGGALPPGMELDAPTGVLWSVGLEAAGQFEFTVQAADAGGQTTSKRFPLAVQD